MDCNILLDLVTRLGYSLAMSGAETFRVEDSINRILAAYGVESEVWAIPNCITVSIRTADGKSLTRMKRIGFHGNDLDSVERYNSLSRRICAEKPELSVAAQWLEEAVAARRQYKPLVFLLGSLLGAAGFSVFFGGTVVDALCSGLCGLLIGLTDRFLQKSETNPFFRTIVCSFIMTLTACLTGVLGLADNTDAVIIGALMLLVPGLIFTNAMRDIIFGDTNSGVNRIVQVLLTAAAIALGTGVARELSDMLFGLPVNAPIRNYGVLLQCLATLVGCTGFTFLFNIHGKGSFLCALGGMFTWAIYCLTNHFSGDVLISNFTAALSAAVYAEVMARLRKYPATSYLVIALFSLIPGAGIYYTTNHLVQGDMTRFAEQGTHTIAIAGVIAVGILMASTLIRLVNKLRTRKR